MALCVRAIEMANRSNEPFILAWVDLSLDDVERLYDLIARAQRQGRSITDTATRAAR